MTAEARHCIKCGREVGPDETMCAVCNRAGMATPSATQYHGTVAVAIVLAVVALAFAAGATLRGIGPWTAAVSVAEAAGDSVAVTMTVTNEGSSSGRAKCRIVARGDRGEVLRSRNFVTTAIAGGESSRVTESVPGLTDVPPTLDVSCE